MRRSHPWTAVVALAATGLSGCAMGLGTRAPGIDEYALLESVRTTWYDSSGRETDSSRGSYYRSSSTYRSGSKLDWGASIGFRTGLSQVQANDMERSFPGFYWSLLGQLRMCPSDSLCFGVDAGPFDQGSTFTRSAPNPLAPGSNINQDVHVNLDGWQYGGVIQYALFEPLWVEAGFGWDKVTIARTIGTRAKTLAEPAWGNHWLLAAGLAFESWGLRMGYSRIGAVGTVEKDVLDVTGSAWTLELIL